MTEHNSYPLPIDGLEPATGMHGHQWASPSLSALRSLMAQVASNPTEARERGRYTPPPPGAPSRSNTYGVVLYLYMNLPVHAPA